MTSHGNTASSRPFPTLPPAHARPPTLRLVGGQLARLTRCVSFPAPDRRMVHAVLPHTVYRRPAPAVFGRSQQGLLRRSEFQFAPHAGRLCLGAEAFRWHARHVTQDFLATIAFNLLRAAGAAASPRHAHARWATLRSHLIAVPARIATCTDRAPLGNADASPERGRQAWKS